MPELTFQHIELISLDIRRQEINFSHLPEELIDHLCCDVEYEMQKGLSFQEAYRNVKQKMGRRRLKEIQEETLYAVDTKYRQMKTTMKISGVAGTIMFGFAALFKIQHWTGAAILMTLGALTLTLVFLPSALNVLWKETHNTKRLFLFVSAFLAGAFFIAGTLFKIQHWPGAGYILIFGTISLALMFIPALLINRLNDQENKSKKPVYLLGAAGVILYIAGGLFKIQHWPLSTAFMVIGIIILCIIAFPWYTWLTWKDESHISRVFIFMIIGFLLLIVPGAMVNLNLQNSYQYRYYPTNNQQNELFKYLLNNNNLLVSRYHDSLSYQKLEQLHGRTATLLGVISGIQGSMVQESEGEPGKPAISAAQIIQNETGTEILYNKLSRPFQTDPYADFLMPGTKGRQEINQATQEYLNYLSGVVPGEAILGYKKLLDPSTYLPVDANGNKVISLMSGLHSLEVMKNGILTAESCVLNEIVKH